MQLDQDTREKSTDIERRTREHEKQVLALNSFFVD